MTKKRAAFGFTLIELLISVAIVATLAVGATSLIENSVRRAKEFELRSDLRQMREAIDAYKRASDNGTVAHSIDSSGYPPNLEILVSGVADAKSPLRRKIYFLRRLPSDPMADTESGNHGWGLRSYASDPDDPQPGRDVFDVYSTSPKVGLNGVPYSKW
jgi:general secretion pathway protein G